MVTEIERCPILSQRHRVYPSLSTVLKKSMKALPTFSPTSLNLITYSAKDCSKLDNTRGEIVPRGPSLLDFRTLAT